MAAAEFTNEQQLQVFFDGACPLCSRECGHYKKRDKLGRIAWVDISRPDFVAGEYGLDSQQVQKVMHARDREGKVFTEVRAFVKIWQALPWRVWTGFLRMVLKIPGMMWLAGKFYRLFARNRYRFTGRCTAESCELPPPGR